MSLKKISGNWWSRAVVLAIALVCIALNFTYLPVNNLAWDVFGYYLYLPLLFIYNDLGLNDVSVIHDIIAKYQSTGTFYQANQMPSGTWVMKYSTGMAILYLPFFLIGHLVALFSEYPADGFSAPYRFAILLGGIFYSIAGFFILRKVLLRFFSDGVSALVLFIIYFGTNYIFQSSFHGGNAMSHNWLFTVYAAILWLTIKWHEFHKTKHIIALGIACGLMILARPSEIVCLLIPLLWGVSDWSTFKRKWAVLLEYKWQLILFTAIVFCIGFIQLLYWKIYTGSFLYYSYGANAGEGFEFFHPYILEVLFSFRKGWFIYTPIMVFAIFGFYWLYKKQKQLFLPILLFTLANIYIVSSWSCWWYAQSFGSRALIQSLAVMALPFGAFCEAILKRHVALKVSIMFLMALFIALNLFQSWQFERGMIHGSRMTKEYYFKIFGQLGVSDEDRNLLLVERSSTLEESITDEHLFDKRLLKVEDMESLDQAGISTEQSFSGNSSFKSDPDNAYSPNISIAYSDITSHYYAWLRVSMMIYPTADIQTDPANFVINFEHDGYAYKYRAHFLEKQNLDLKVNEWNKVSFDYMTPEVRITSDNLKTYFHNRGQAPIYVDDITVEVLEPKNR